MSSWTEIQDLDVFIDKIRKISFDKFIEINKSFESEEEYWMKLKDPKIDSIITINETKNIVMSLIEEYNFGYRCSQDNLYKIIEELNSRMISNSLSNLVNSGVLESAFDDKLNDFVFWIK